MTPTGGRPGRHVRPRGIAGPLLAVAAALLCAPGLAAQPTATTVRVVDVVIAATPAQATVLEDALREPIERQGIRLRWMRVEWFELSSVVMPDPAAPTAVARAWFDLAGISRRPGDPPGAVAVVYLADGSWERVLVRRVPLDAGLDEVAREELAQILGSSVEGILAGSAPGRPREEVREELGVAPTAPEPEPEPPPPVAEPSFPDRFTLDLGIGWEPGGFASETSAVHGFGLCLGLTQRTGGVRFGGWIAGQYRLPIEVERDGVGARLDIGALRLLVGAEIPFSSWFALQAAVGGGVDIARVEPRRTGDVHVALEPVATEGAGVLQALIGGRFAVGAGISLWLGLGVDVDPSKRRYVVDRDGTREAVLEPWPARPFGLLRLTFDLLER